MNVAIVGYGITGSALACLLARRGISVQVFEQAPALGPVGAGVLLQPSGQQVLGAMGLLDDILQQAEPISRVRVTTRHGRELIRLDYNEWSPGLTAYGIHRGRLFERLYRACAGLNMRFQLGTRIQSCTSTATSAQLEDEAGKQYGPFEWVFGCDGNHSTLLAQSGLRVTEHMYRHGALWHVGSLSGLKGELLQATDGSRRLCGLLPTAPDECSLFWGATADEAEHMRLNFEAWKREGMTFFPEAAPILSALTSPDELRFTTWRHRQTSGCVIGRLLLLGDAAFASSPHLGQGVNLGLLDAWTLDRLIGNTHDISIAVRQYPEVRAEQRRFYGTLSTLLSPFFQSSLPGLGIIRDLGLQALTGLPSFRRQMIDVLSGLRKGWRGGHVSV
jgi:2-polyprenyl-6-methoxyphenol hydroxylase-like FAD-dependent oxidoreductase